MKERILLVFDKGLGHGGVESVIMSIVRNLSDSYTFDLLTNTSQEKSHDKEFESYGGQILRIPFYEGQLRFFQRADYYIRGAYLYANTVRTIRKNMPYVAIHCNNSTEGGIVLAAAKKVGIPLRIMHSHAVFAPQKNIRKLITDYYRKLIIKNANCLIGCSKLALNMYLDEKKCKVIHNSYDDKRFYLKHNAVSNSGNIRLIQVGRYDQIKNQHFSLNILKEIINYIPNATLDLVGSNGEKSELELRNLAHNLGISDHVCFYKSNSDIPELLNKADVFLFPSRNEGFGIALIEAQAMGLKCYASTAVPKETNCGAVDYLSLDAGANVWACKIADDYFAGLCNKREYDCSRFSEKEVLQKYKNIYKGD